MTKAEAKVLGRRWKRRAYPIACEHLTMYSERNQEGHATGTYICILCGEFFAAQAQQSPLIAEHY